MISFKTTKPELLLIEKITVRAMALAKKLGVNYKHSTCLMDLCACHANGCKLKLDELLAADDFNFAHEVFGIRRHMNRDTGELMNCFVPRFAVHQ